MAEPKTQKHEQPQPLDLETSERLGTTARAVAQGVGHTIKGDYTTQKGERETVSPERLENILEDWPGPQKNVAKQMIEKYGIRTRLRRPNFSGTTMDRGSERS